MFWDKWIPEKFYVKSEVCGLEVLLSEDGKTIYYTHLKNTSKKLQVIKSGTDNNYDLPVSISKNKIPLVVIINGKGIILKKVLLDAPTGFEEILKTHLPAINADEFYIQYYSSNETAGYLALVRKEQADNIINELKNKSYDIAEVLIGSAAVNGIKPLWSNLNSISTSLHSIELTNGEIEKITPGVISDRPIQLDTISLLPSYTLSFAGGLAYLMQDPLTQNNCAGLSGFRLQHINKNKLSFLMICMVGLALFISVVNVAFYTSYFDNNNKLETELQLYQSKYEQVNQLLTDYQKKKDLIENAGILTRNRLSEFADKIATSIPEEIVLSELYFNPKIENTDSEDSMVVFKTNELIIKGNCNKSLVVNEWINVLKMQKFIKDVNLEKFAYNSDGNLPNYEIKVVTE